MLTTHLKQRERQLAEMFQDLTDRELADLILTIQRRPTTNRRDARYTYTYIKVAREELHRRRACR